MAPLDQVLDQAHDFGDRLARQGLLIGPSEPEEVGVVLVGRRHLLGQDLAGDAGLAGRHVDLVVDVRDVCHELDVVALVGQKPLEQGEDDERAGVAHVHAAVDRRPAGIDPHSPRGLGDELPDLPGPSVMERHGAQRGRTLAPAGCRRRIRPHENLHARDHPGQSSPLIRWRCPSPQTDPAVWRTSRPRSGPCLSAIWAPIPGSTRPTTSGCCDLGHTWEVRCTAHGARVRKGATRRAPDVTISTDAETWLALRAG